MVRKFLAAAIASACVAACPSIAAAQANYPEKPLQLIVPFPAGGASDVVGRIVAGELEARLGKPVIVINRPGGGTTIAAKEVAIAAPDGYTLFSSSNSTFTLQNAVNENVPTLEEAIASPSVIERFQKVGYEPGFKRYSDWPGFIAKETAEMKELARQGGIKEE